MPFKAILGDLDWKISVTSKMVKKVIMNLDSSKASGPDVIPTSCIRPFLLLGNSKNSILNRVLELNLLQQKMFNPNAPNNVSFYDLIKH